ncbi:AAA family ATPase, partial [Methylophaga sp. UBA1464]
MLTELTLTHFRNIQKAVVYPDPGINILSGENGSGKTSVLEAIYLLAMGRSFRTRNLKNVIQTDEVHFQVFARIKPGIPVGLQFSSATGIQIRLNNAPLKKLSELASHLPLQYIPANCHQFFELGPAFRRRVVDWGLFHVEQDFLFHWQA